MLIILLLANSSLYGNFLETLELCLRQVGTSIEEFATQMRPIPKYIENNDELDELMAGAQRIENNQRARQKERLCNMLCLPAPIITYFTKIWSNE